MDDSDQASMGIFNEDDKIQVKKCKVDREDLHQPGRDSPLNASTWAISGMQGTNKIAKKKEVHNQVHGSFGTFTKYDVFLNHRGPDLKRSFVSHLEKELRRAGCDPFLDAKSLVKGQHAFNSINKALTGVLVHIAVFSPGYAESKYCLNELCDMLVSGKRMILVFYDVEPENLRWTNKGPFAKAFQEHIMKGRDQDVMKWKEALLQAAAITGFRRVDYKNDTKLVEKVVAAVLKVLPAPPPLAPAQYPVGLKESSTCVLDMLHKMGNNVGVVGICGMGGIGKTTLAREVYNQEQSKFQNRCFLKDVKEAKGVAVTDLQMKMITDLIHVDAKKMHWDYARWFEKIQNLEVLLVIDDISERKQFDELIPDLEKLAPGSRVIITTRELDILKNIIMDIPQSEIYHMPVLSPSNSLDLFIWCAFRKNNIGAVDASFHDFVIEITKACGGLPLALEVMGGFLADKKILPDDLKYWKDATLELRRNGDISTRLQISYDGLVNDDDKLMFLDIACFMLGHPKELAMEIWQSSDDYGSAQWSLRRLIDKCLVKVDYNGQLSMHDLLRDMGHYVVLKRAQNKIEMQSHIWDPSRATKILTKKNGSNEVLALSVVGVDHAMTFNAKQYARMRELRYLILDSCPVKGNFSGWSEELRWLQWRNMPHPKLPSSLKLPYLIVLDLANSFHLTHLWTSNFELKCLYRELRILILKNCTNLEELPQHINELVKLKFLDLQGCESLTSLPNSLRDLTELECINLSFCSNLKILPNLDSIRSLRKFKLTACKCLTTLPISFFNLYNLEELDLSWCEQLQMLPPSISRLKKLKEFYMMETPIQELPEDFGQLQSLTMAHFNGCKSLIKLPKSFSELFNLEELDLSSCKQLQMLPPSISGLKKLKRLYMMETPIQELPEDFGQLQSLRQADFSCCKSLIKLPKSFSELFNLKDLDLSNCEQLQMLPPSISRLKKLKGLYMMETPIQELHEDFGQLQSLTQADFRGCKSLIKLPKSFSELFNLKELDLSSCEQLQMLPPSISGLKKLKRLYMMETPIQELPEDFGQLQSLTQADFRGCKSLIKLRKSFSELFNLEELDLSSCEQLQMLPLSVSGLKKLEDLYMMETPIQELPEDFGQLQSLTKADFRGCKSLIKLPKSFSELFNLEELDLSSCEQLQMLPPSISGLKKLKRLYMMETPIQELPEDFGQLQSLIKVEFIGCEHLIKLPKSFSELFNLEELHLSWCEQLQMLPPSISGLKKLKVLYMMNTSIQELPEDFGQLQSLTKAYFSGCKSLIKLPKSFSELFNLEELDLSSCEQLQMLPPSISGLKKLKGLYMMETPIQELPEDFGQLQSLRKADFSGCKSLIKLPKSFSELFNLEELNLSRCEQLQMLPPSISGLKKLKRLYMMNTTIQELLEDFGQLQSLTKANFSGCKSLIKLPKSFSELFNLEELNLSRCEQLQMLPPSISGLKKLKRLYMMETPIQELPEDFGQLQSLTMAHFNGCKSLIKLPKSFSELFNLEELDLSSCEQLQMLPPSISGLKKLKRLYMMETPIQELPEDFGQLQSLRQADFSGCKSLIKLPKSFSELFNLEELDLSSCEQLQMLPPSISGLKKLKRPYMMETPIQELPEDFGQLQSLTQAYFSGCKSLIKLPKSFSELFNLEELDLSSCEQLQMLPPSISGLKKLEELYMMETPIQELPEDFGQLQSLTKANFSGCKSLMKLPKSFSELFNLEELDLSKCEQLQMLLPSVSGFKKLKVLYMMKRAIEELPEDFGQLQTSKFDKG